MAKRTPEELKQLALEFLWLDGDGDRRADFALQIISQFTGLTFTQIREEVRKLARYGEEE